MQPPEWMAQAFDSGSSLYHKRSHNPFVETPFYEPTLDELRDLFLRPEVLEEHYSLDEIGEGLYYVCSGSEWMFLLREESLPLQDRRRTLDAVATLYERMFMRHCSDPEGNRPMDTICFMWFDVMPIHASTSADGLEDVLYDVLEKILWLPNDPCRYAALHGISENAYAAGWSEIGKRIVDRFLAHHSELSPKLVQYAKLARDGQVL